MYTDFEKLINKELISLIENAGHIKKFQKDEMIYHQGEAAMTFYYLKEGSVKVFMTSFDGVEKTLNTAVSGELLGEGAFFDKSPRVSSARAITDCEVVMIDYEILIDLISQNPNLAIAIMEILSNKIRNLTSQINLMTFMHAEERIATYLIENSKGPLICFTHEEIAAAVGVTRITVSKILSRFADNGIIQTKYRHIVLKDIDALKKVAKS
ncbi:MAG: Crp/Fnr family transcriptional regulator [Ruminococcus sp.]|nr:Crp/Fnr family transcriptional regulator [Ruminococcus sp.]